jgi:cathepsin L
MVSRVAFLPFVAAELPLIMPWEDWKATFGIAFNGEEEAAQRRAVYESTIAFIESENSKGHSFTLGVNQFSHLTEEEFVSQYTGAVPDEAEDAPHLGQLEAAVRADAVDWTTKGVVNSIKDQGSCGSCWAFSAVGTVESAYAVHSGKLLNLAEQELLDCADYTQAGCGGGYNDKAMTFISQHGACSEASYPYTAKDFDDDKCQADKTETGKDGTNSCSVALPIGAVTGFSDVGKSSTDLEAALNVMPVSVTIRADSTFQSYRSGVLSASCPFLGQINHAVIAVGYDSESFKIRNSWGKAWGEEGYVRLAKEAGSHGAFCLFKNAPVVPTLSSSVSV